MTPTEAAAVIGCHPRYVRTLIRKGKLAAKPLPTACGYVWEIDRAEAERFRDQPQPKGYPRGVPRRRKRTRRQPSTPSTTGA